MSSRIGIAAAIALLPLAASTGLSQSPAAGAPSAAGREALAFVAALERAATAGDRRAMATLVHYPLTVQASGLAIPIANRDEFLRYYDSVVTEAVVEAIATAHAALRTRRLDPQAVAASPDGLVIGGRTVVARRVDDRYGIVQMTVSPAARRWRAASRAVQVIAFRRGEPPAKRRGALARGEQEVHVLHVPRGRLLSVRIDEVEGDAVVATVVDHRTGAPLDERAGSGVRVWRGRVRADTDVRIVVSRRGGSRPVLGYLLTVDSR